MNTYVLTGATSGIGAHALKILTQEQNARIVIGARTPEKAQVPAGVEVLPLDLSSLKSVRSFAQEVARNLSGDLIDALVLNAGINSAPAGAKTEEGFNLVFGTNHLSHYLLLRLLLPHVRPHGRIVVTTSDTHDPKIVGVGPKAMDFTRWVQGRTSGVKVYAASKLGNLMSAQTISESSEVISRSIHVVAFNPGLTGGTGLNRALPSPIRRVLHWVKPVVSFASRFNPALYVNHPEVAGKDLAALAQGRIFLPAGTVYASMVRGKLTYPPVSTLAQDPDARTQMWQRSAELVGLEP